MSSLLKEKRQTRGLRMSELVGEALENDLLFYNNEIWEEEESDESYVSEEEKPDVFDSDFNESEDEDDSDDDEENDTRRKERSAAREKSGGRYKEPGQPKIDSKPKIKNESEVRQRMPVAKRLKRDDSMNSMDSQQSREIRSSTKKKTAEAEKLRRVAASKSPRLSKTPIKHKFSQKELLLDALMTEEENERWLLMQQDLSSGKASSEKRAIHSTGSSIRFSSRRGTGDTVTFTDVDAIPRFLTHLQAPNLPERVCCITGLPARYRDPRTNLPYANIEAYRELKKRCEQ